MRKLARLTLFVLLSAAIAVGALTLLCKVPGGDTIATDFANCCCCGEKGSKWRPL